MSLAAWTVTRTRCTDPRRPATRRLPAAKLGMGLRSSAAPKWVVKSSDAVLLGAVLPAGAIPAETRSNRGRSHMNTKEIWCSPVTLGTRGVDRHGNEYRTPVVDRAPVTPRNKESYGWKAEVNLDFYRPIYTITSVEMFDSLGEVVKAWQVPEQDIFPNEGVTVMGTLE